MKEKKKQEPQEPNRTAEATKIIAEEKTKRIQQCGERIGKILEELGCNIVPVVVIRGNQVASEVQIITR